MVMRMKMMIMDISLVFRCIHIVIYDFRVRSGSSESYCWFSFASACQLFLAVESSSLFHLCIRLIFMFSEMLH